MKMKMSTNFTSKSEMEMKMKMKRSTYVMENRETEMKKMMNRMKKVTRKRETERNSLRIYLWLGPLKIGRASCRERV